MRDKPKLGQLLLQAGAISSIQLSAALADQRRWGGALGSTLVRMRFLDEETLVRTLARQLRLPIAWLRGKRIAPEVLAVLPRELIEEHRCLPLLITEENGSRLLHLAMEDPCDLAALDDVSFRAGMKVRAVLVAPSELADAISYHFNALSLPSERTALESQVISSEEDQPELLLLEDGPIPELPGFEAQPTASGEPERKVGGATPAAVLRALVQLLAEKEIISQGELVAELGEAFARVSSDSQ